MVMVCDSNFFVREGREKIRHRERSAQTNRWCWIDGSVVRRKREGKGHR